MLAFALMALALQSLTPPGYMPADLASGWLVMLCPDGLPDGFLDREGTSDGRTIGDGHAGHHGHGGQHQGHAGHGATDEDAAADSTSGHHAESGADCPLGGMLDTAAPSLPTLLALAEQPSAPTAPAPCTTPTPARHGQANRPRAPPA